MELLNELRKNPGSSDSDLAAAAGISVEEAGAILEDLTRCGLADSERSITPSGFEALEPYKVDNAIILAAGMSRRFAPFSYDMPKGLLVCKGEVLIERQIRQLHEAGISQIIVVVGYLMEQFAYLEDKLGVTLVANDDYAKRNNHSSIYAVRDYLGNSYICSSDNYFTENVFDAYVHDSYYSSVFMPGVTPERALTADAEGIIVETEKPARDAWVMYGHAYWSRSFLQEVPQDPRIRIQPT